MKILKGEVDGKKYVAVKCFELPWLLRHLLPYKVCHMRNLQQVYKIVATGAGGDQQLSER